MPATTYRTMSAIDPDGKRHTKTVSLSKFSNAHIDLHTPKWKAAIRRGDQYEFPVEARPELAPRTTLFDTYDISKLCLFPNGGTSLCLIGSTRSGKSTAFIYIWELLFKKHCTILSTLSRQADIYKPVQKSAVVAQGFHKELISDAMKINNATNNKYPFLFVFDDLALDGKNSPAMTKLLTVGRNSNCSVIISGQKSTMLSATGRSNCNYVLLFKQNSELAIEDSVKCFLRSYFPANMTIPEMCRAYRELTADHSFFIVDTINDTCHLSKIPASEVKT